MRNSQKSIVFVAAGLLSASFLPAQSLEGDFRKEGVHVRAAYDELTEIFQASSAAIYDQLPSGYGVVVSGDGQILVKASEFDLMENPSVIVGKKRYRDLAVLATSPEWDVSLIKVEAEGLQPIEFSESEPEHGSIVLSNSSTSRFKRRAQLGVVAANSRPVGSSKLAVLGVSMVATKDDRVQIESISPNSGARDAGLEVGDVLLSINGTEVVERENVPELIGEKAPGELIAVVVRRKVVLEGEPESKEVEDPFSFVEENPPSWEELSFEVELRERQEVFPEQLTRNDQMSGEFSKRRTNFPKVLQHDTSLAQRTTGGPLLTLDGKCVGMNIAFASRECTYAIPAAELQELITELQAQAGL